MKSETDGSFTPERLRLIREAREMTQTALAEAAGIASSSVSQYEAGNTHPSPESLAKMSDALDVGEDFLKSERPPLLSEESPHFRKQSGLTRQSQRMLLAWGTLTAELISRLERYVTFPSWTAGDYRDELDEGVDPERIAEQVRRDLGLGFGPISNMVWLLEGVGAFCLEIPTDIDDVDALDAFSTWSRDLSRPVVFLGSGKKSATRRRFDIAHELGHLLLHRNRAPSGKGLEEEANTFAAGFLLPEDPFTAECPRRLVWSELIELKQRWKVSLAAIVRRAFELGIYSEATYRRGFSQLNRRGWRKNEPAEPEMERPGLIRDAFAKVRQVKGEPREWMGASLGSLSQVYQRHLFSWASAA